MLSSFLLHCASHARTPLVVACMLLYVVVVFVADLPARLEWALRLSSPVEGAISAAICFPAEPGVPAAAAAGVVYLGQGDS